MAIVHGSMHNAKFTRKHYQAIAEAMREARRRCSTPEHFTGWAAAYNCTVAMLKADNQQFNDSTFRSAVWEDDEIDRRAREAAERADAELRLSDAAAERKI
jgi:hypothetical protein